MLGFHYLFLMLLFMLLCLDSFPCIHMILYLSLFLYLMNVMLILLCLSIAQHVVDLVPWCADSSSDYYKERVGEEILEDLQPPEEQQEWHADNVE